MKLPLYMLCSETIVRKFPSQQVNLAAQYQLLRRGSTAPLRVQTKGNLTAAQNFPLHTYRGIMEYIGNLFLANLYGAELWLEPLLFQQRHD